MKRFVPLLISCILLFLGAVAAFAADAAPATGADTASTADTAKSASAEAQKDLTTKAAAAAEVQRQREVDTPDFLEHLVDSVLELFDMRSSGNTLTHYVICSLLLVVELLARRIVTGILFPLLRRAAAKTQTTLDDKLFPALEGPVAAFVMTVGIFAALKVLKLDPAADKYIAAGSQVAFSLVIFWGLWRGLSAVLEHAHELAKAKSSGISAFMPWIRKTLLTVFVVLGVLLTMQSLGFDVKAILAGLGIGSLAFALAAQDSLANIFGAIVVAVDQPFKVGEAVRIAGNVGGVEDIGLRSTRIRLVDKSLMIIPNKTVAGESITNFSRFTRRRVEQVIGLTYDTTPEQMQSILEDIRTLIASDGDVDKASVMVFFRDFSASSLDLWVVYEMPDPDFQKGMRTRERINLAMMRLVDKRGLSFAFPTQTVHLAGDVVEQLVQNKVIPPPAGDRRG